MFALANGTPNSAANAFQHSLLRRGRYSQAGLADSHMPYQLPVNPILRCRDLSRGAVGLQLIEHLKRWLNLQHCGARCRNRQHAQGEPMTVDQPPLARRSSGSGGSPLLRLPISRSAIPRRETSDWHRKSQPLGSVPHQTRQSILSSLLLTVILLIPSKGG